MNSTEATGKQIAIIGMAFRFPGDHVSATRFWDFLNSGETAICDTPADRFDIEPFYSPDPDVPGTTYSRRAGFVRHPYSFDAEFFRISAAEALEMDPQQRWLLELCWAALENAGIAPSQIRGKRVGLFLTVGEVDYGRRTVWSGDARGITTYAKLGSNRGVAAGRVAYCLGAQGPAVFVDTACSSSLVAVHLAAQSLRTDDCDLAIAGGVNLILGPEETIGVARLHAMSTTETCRPFDSDADGYMRGEGGGVFVLKRLPEAIGQGDRVDAILAGSAINNDGASNGLTAPNGAAQEAVIRHALKQANARPEDIAYVEAHGTGTPLGDPIELSALRNVYTRGVDRKAPLLVGSVKSQLGHLEVAAGIPGLVKAILVLRHRFVPPQAHFAKPNPRFRWDGSHVQVSSVGQALPDRDVFVGISGFGISGTNAHLILAPGVRHKVAAPVSQELVLAVSGKSAKARLRLANEYRQLIERERVDLRDLCYTASVKRDHWNFRLAVVGSSKDDFVRALDDFMASDPTGTWHAGDTRKSRRLAFLFPGQGAWRPGAGAGLYQHNAIFRAAADQCLSLLTPQVAGEVLSAIQGNNATSVRHHPGQLAHFVVLFSLARTWIELGQIPDVVIGHSLGEHVAAVIAGVMSLEHGLKAVEARGRLFDTATPRGAMLAVQASVDELSTLMEFGKELFVAGLNGPEQTVVSGTAAAVAAAEATMIAMGRRVSLLKTYDTPGHSPLLCTMRAPFRQALSELHFSSPRIRIVSTVTGQMVGDEVATVDHWLDLVEQPVRFSDALKVLVGEDLTFLEVGPGAALSNLARAATGDWQRAVSSLADGPDGDEETEPTGFAHACAHLYSVGHAVKWDPLYGAPRVPAEAPSYSFEPVHLELPLPKTAAPSGAAAGADAQPGIRDHAQADASSAAPAFHEPGQSAWVGSDSGDTILAAIRKIASSVATHSTELDDASPLREQGFDSLALTELRVRLHQTLGRMPPMSLFAKGVSLNGLASFFAAGQRPSDEQRRAAAQPHNAATAVTGVGVGDDQPSRSSTSGTAIDEESLVVTLRDGEGPVVALVHPVGGDVLCYQELAAAWPGDLTVVGVRHPESDGERAARYRSVEQLAALYREELVKALGRLPDVVGGWSFGGIIAHEMAAQWETIGITAPPLVIVDSPFHNGEFAASLRNIVRDLNWSRGTELVEQLKADTRFQRLLEDAIGLASVRERLEPTTFSRLSHLHASSAAATAWHSPKVVRTPISYALALKGRNGRSCDQVTDPLRRMTQGQIRLCGFEDDHHSIVRAPTVTRLAAFLNGSVDASSCAVDSLVETVAAR
ncbi:hypothetical protein LMG29542_04896 [Paraburkholderia humisilvae]|uniref:Uncharacterized protein n=2 Tax=Paraburkholderia humisilvae TaxID=627669 RepID=A0A6J5EGC8_9BURK|nr:hypothetical protein LMG29542_04896 [Paraburkholderia humisilvae]